MRFVWRCATQTQHDSAKQITHIISSRPAIMYNSGCGEDRSERESEAALLASDVSSRCVVWKARVVEKAADKREGCEKL